MGRYRRDFEYAPIAITVLIIMIFWYISRYPQTINMDPGAGELLVSLFPGIFLGLISMYTLAEAGGYFQVPALMGIGMSLCFLIGDLNTNGLVSTQMLSGLTIGQIQVWIMVLSSLMGGLLYTYKK